MTWMYFFGLQLCFITMVLGFGYSASISVERTIASCLLHWIDRICIASVVVVLALAALGMAIALVPWSWRFFLGCTGTLLLLLSSLYLIAKRRYYRDFANASGSEKTFFCGYVVLCALALAISLWPARLPENLVDGPYVAKHDVLGVRVQYITGNLPTDNSIPHVVSEYLLRGISFQYERPIMPGQEVTNRPILASLVILPFRAAIDMPAQWQGSLPRFDYVGSSWPDFSILMRSDRAYLISLTIGIALNGLLLLSLGSFALRLNGINSWVALGVVGMFLTSSYFLFQTMFTWPKELAAFFVLFAFIAVQRMRSSTLAGTCLGLSYLSHPYAIVFFAAHLAWIFSSLINVYWNKKVINGRVLRNASKVLSSGFRILGSFVLVVSPWVLWSKVYLDIPSDLIAQNFFQVGQSLIDFFWVRVVNIFNLISPIHLMNYPFDLMRMTSASTVNIAGSIGLVMFVFALHSLFVDFEPKIRAVYIVYWFLPSLMLVIIFSNQAVPALHGLQAPIALLLLVGVLGLFRFLSRAWFLFFIGAQLFVNFIFLSRYLYRLL